jgi:Ni/Co efflux regulator RcnB
MLATIRNRIHLKLALLAVSSALTSCATKQTAFLNDANEKKENMLPWNEQQDWERQGEARNLSQQHR